MREREHDHESEELHQQGGPERAEPGQHEIAAAATGRVDALGSNGLLSMQRYAGNAATGASVQRSKVHDVLARPSGSPVPADVRGMVERNYGPVPADARVHTDSEALDSAREVGAYAYASGRDIVMPADAPRKVQLEETVHLVQQSRGPVAGTDTGTGVSVSSPTDSFEMEAQQTAAALDSAGPDAGGSIVGESEALPAVDGSGTAPVQRSVEEEELEEE